MSDYTVVFPRVLSRLNYLHLLTSGDFSHRTVDGREILRWYFLDMSKGVAYEKYVQNAENTACPNRLTEGNFRNTKNVNSQGWSYEGVAVLIDKEWTELSRIPMDADIFTTNFYDSDVISILDTMRKTPGIDITNATKLLYQKRPKLVSIFDDFVRKAIGYYWVHGYPESFRLGFQQIREVESHGDNSEALDRLEHWLRTEPQITGGLTISRLRILDILAWGVIRKG